MANDKNTSSSFSPLVRNELSEENSQKFESGNIIPHITNPNNEQPGGVVELSEELTEDNSSPPSIADMENIVLEIPIGNDVVEAIIDFARRHEASINVMTGSGLVSDITLLEPDSRVPTFQLDGPFNMLSLAGVYLNPNCFHVPPQLIKDPLCTAFTLQLSGSRGQVFGGVIGGKINAASDIQISAFLLKRPGFVRMVTDDGNVHLFEDDDVPTIVGDVDVDDGGVDARETQSKFDDQILS
ncbi:AT-hook motif nuclear-localized protein 28-like [Vicia villosa]|uniref:AT-hook motif nuclear-localized protein 28-like n=1 Tax=Vicia villosa TaxID=3911 RepID=UPI00273B6B5D|nr:AT-hook motif nuclear-localized protein 28-like [Vicia villosa]